jgi:hypothetical protein
MQILLLIECVCVVYKVQSKEYITSSLKFLSLNNPTKIQPHHSFTEHHAVRGMFRK